MKNILKKIVIAILILIIVGVGGFFIYSLNYYIADNVANGVLNSENVKVEDNIITLYPEEQSDIGIIFYPGGKVEYTAYLPLLNSITEKGYTCFIPKMPLNFAFFGANVADDIIKENSDIKTWYIAGHSLGGAMASSYASKNLDKIEGVILLGAYVYGDIPLEKTLVLYGSNDLVLNIEKLKGTDNEIVIEGGNHAMFGNYGEQKGDGKADITAQEQQKITVEKIDDFIANSF